MKTIGQSLSKEYYIHAIPRTWAEPNEVSHYYEVTTSDTHYATGSVVIAGPIEVTFEIPHNVDLLQPTIDALRDKQKELMDEARTDIAAIEEQVQQMLALPAPTEV